MPHQRYVLDVGLEVQSEAAGDPEPGALAYPDVTWTIQRRGGKTSLITPITAHRARLVKRAQIFITAQTRDKARRRWMDATEDVLGSVLRPDVRRKVAQGFEELRWLDGGSQFVPFAPNEDGLHSETPDLVFVDELWAFSAEQARAIKAGYVPAFATRDGQAFKMSTAGTAESAWLNQVRTAGRAAVEAGTRLGVAYFEFGLPDVVDGVPVDKLGDQELIEACIAWHPAVCHTPGCRGPAAGRPCSHGFTVRPAAIRSAWTEMADRAEFIRAYGNRSTDLRSDLWRGIAEATFVAQIDKATIPAAEPIALGVHVDPESRDAGVSAGWRDPAGGMHVELVAYDAGTRWVVSRVRELIATHQVRCVGIPNVGAARDVGDALSKAGVPVLPISQADVAAASTRHRDELGAGVWWHRFAGDLRAAASVAVVRRTSGGGVLEADPGGDPVSALVSGTFAGWAWDHAPTETKPLPKFWMG